MESAPDLDTVCRALYALYKDPDTKGKASASTWLGDLQKSVYAWQISDQLLHMAGDTDYSYFAAQTMKSKIQNNFNELPTESHKSLCDSLIQHATVPNHSIIQKQLCIALADLAIQMVTWSNPICEMIESFGADSTKMEFMVEFLTVFPEEMKSSKMRIGENRRKLLKKNFLNTSKQLIIYLKTMDLSTIEKKCKAYQCMQSIFDTDIFRPYQKDCILLIQPVIEDLVRVAKNLNLSPKLYCEAIELLKSVIISSGVIPHQEDNEGYHMVDFLYSRITELITTYHHSLHIEDIDKMTSLAQIFAIFVDSFEWSTVSKVDDVPPPKNYINFLILLAENHQYEIIEYTFGPWNRIMEEVNENSSRCNYAEYIKPQVNKFIGLLCRHCQFNTDQEGLPDANSEFVEFRDRASNVIDDIYYLAGYHEIYQVMFDILMSPNAPWEVVESSLYVLTTLAQRLADEYPRRNKPSQATQYLPMIYGAILQLPDSAHILLRHTAIILVGELVAWVKNNKTYLDPTIVFLATAISEPQLSVVAAVSIRQLCTECSSDLIGHFPSLMNMVKQINNNQEISNDVVISLLNACVVVLSKMDSSIIHDCMSQLCSIQVKPLLEIMKTHKSETKVVSDSNTDPITYIDRLSIIFRHTKPDIKASDDHPCQPVITEIWTTLSHACEVYQTDSRIVERCCRCIRFAIRCIGTRSESILLSIVTQMVSLYERNNHSCYLYLGSILVDEYGRQKVCQQGLLEMFKAFCTPVFKTLEEENGMRNNPDTVDDFSRLCLRLVEQCPVVFLTSDIIDITVICLIHAIRINHREAHRSVCKFISCLVDIALNKDTQREDMKVARAVLHRQGPLLVLCMMNYIIHDLPSYLLMDLAEIYKQIFRMDPQATKTWLKEALNSISQNQANAGKVTQDQIQDFYLELSPSTEKFSLTAILNSLRVFQRYFR